MKTTPKVITRTLLLATIPLLLFPPLLRAETPLYSKDFESTAPPAVPENWVVTSYSAGDLKPPVTLETRKGAGKDGSIGLAVKVDFTSMSSFWGLVVSSPGFKNPVAASPVPLVLLIER